MRGTGTRRRHRGEHGRPARRPALADAYERVTIVERDKLPAGAEQRRAVPQGRHVHALLPRGAGAASRSCCPGITAELIDAGAATYEALSEMHFVRPRPRARARVDGHRARSSPAAR